LLSAGAFLYILFFSDNAVDQEVEYFPEQGIEENQSAQTEEENENPPPEVESIYAQSFGESNTISGSIEIQIPKAVFQKYGAGIGITTLSLSDLSLPEGTEIAGGIFSIYPSGIDFDEPIIVKIYFSDFPEGALIEDLSPAYVFGIQWREIENYQSEEKGFSFSLDKFPTGPIAIIRKHVSSGEEEDDQESHFLRPIPSQDSDNDGLTDLEEDLFGTNPDSVDSDNDSYGDLEEIRNGYSPILGDGARIETAGIFAEYTNETYGYKVFYPAEWLADSLDKTNKQVLFISETEEFFEILIEENPLKTPIVDWYRSQSPSLSSVDLDIVVIDSSPAVWSIDGLTLYTSKDGLIYIITYNKGTKEDINWPNIFDYFYKSFKFGNTSSSSSGDSDETDGADSGEEASAEEVDAAGQNEEYQFSEDLPPDA